MTAVDDLRDPTPTGTPVTPGPSPVAPDWVALMPAGGLGRVAVVGPLTEGALAALAAGDQAADGGPADTIVVTDDRRRPLSVALSRLVPGGTLRIERSHRLRRPAVRRALRRAGCRELSTWWHRPSQAVTGCLVRVDRPVAAATVIRTVGNRGRWTRVEAVLARTGIAGSLSAEVSLMAVAPGGAEEVGALAQPRAGHPVDGLVTPRYSTSRAVVGISTTDGGRRLDQVAKVARRPSDDDLIAQEARNLDDLVRRAGPFPSAPPAARTVVRAGRTVLVEGAVPGVPLDRRAVRDDPAGALASGRRWVEGLPVGERTRPIDDGRAQALIHDPLTIVATRPGPRAELRAELAGRAGRLLAPLESTPVPVVFEHGDLSHPNLLRDAAGTLGVVDWERARTDGFPLHDLTFFIAYLTESIEEPGSPEELAHGVCRALHPHGWARTELEVHIERLALDRWVVPLLPLACWTRRLAAVPADLAAADRPPSRDEVLWAATIEDLEGRRR